jgi:hypothetical protein
LEVSGFSQSFQKPFRHFAACWAIEITTEFLHVGMAIHAKIVVSGGRAQLYLDEKERPAFLVNGLKLGVDPRGGVRIWIESGTIAHFRNLRVTHAG